MADIIRPMSFYQGKTVLVTGAAGFIPSHLVDALLAEGAYVIGVDNFLTGRQQNIAHLNGNPNFYFIDADVIGDPATYLPGNKPLDAVFHMASPASPPGYQEHPVETYMVNSMGTHQLLTYLKEQNPHARFLFASTSEAYGDPLVHPQTEDYYGNVNPNGIRSMYDEAKRLGETICGVFHRTFHIDTRIIRIFNTYGPRMDPNDGRSLVEFAVRAFKNEPLVIYGDGSQTRSYCYVSDLVNGLMLLMSTDAASGETINIGNPEEITMNRLAEEIIAKTNSSSTIVHEVARADDPKKRCPDISKAKRILGFEPTISLEEGIKPTLEYFHNEITPHA